MCVACTYIAAVCIRGIVSEAMQGRAREAMQDETQCGKVQTMYVAPVSCLCYAFASPAPSYTFTHLITPLHTFAHLRRRLQTFADVYRSSRTFTNLRMPSQTLTPTACRTQKFSVRRAHWMRRCAMPLMTRPRSRYRTSHTRRQSARDTRLRCRRVSRAPQASLFLPLIARFMQLAVVRAFHLPWPAPVLSVLHLCLWGTCIVVVGRRLHRLCEGTGRNHHFAGVRRGQ
mmetsp:Transcript_43932/g.102717  ORF Transcript_43932/g.102717 Transcript_43932/m.102717 type:complete len:229 (+) Transcript_43932:205-891(+)